MKTVLLVGNGWLQSEWTGQFGDISVKYVNEFCLVDNVISGGGDDGKKKQLLL